jgi:hypothetical protein
LSLTVTPPPSYFPGPQVVACTDKLGFAQLNPTLSKALMNIITKGYPDRLGELYTGPVNLFLKSIFSLASTLLPARLVKKIHLMNKPVPQLGAAVGDKRRVPDFFGGEAIHDIADEAGMFSWDKMVAGMKEDK